MKDDHLFTTKNEDLSASLEYYTATMNVTRVCWNIHVSALLTYNIQTGRGMLVR